VSAWILSMLPLAGAIWIAILSAIIYAVRVRT
jgi:Flp pilus assembly protein TadB